MTQDSIPETVMPEGNKSRVSGVGVGYCDSSVGGAPSWRVATQCWPMLGVSHDMLGVHVFDYRIILASLTHSIRRIRMASQTAPKSMIKPGRPPRWLYPLWGGIFGPSWSPDGPFGFGGAETINRTP